MDWKKIRSALENNEKLILLLVIESKGSSPGRQGFKMLVKEDGQLIGSIGGGLMEYYLVEFTKQYFNDAGQILLKKQIHSDKSDSDRSGMICSGSQHVAIIPLDKKILPVVRKIAEADNGEIIFSNTGIDYNKSSSLELPYKCSIKDSSSWTFRERIASKNHLYIFGGGHVGLSLSKIFKELDFRVHIFDDRNLELSTLAQNRYADSKTIIKYDKAAEYLPEGDSIYAVIMTFGHKSDSIILEQLLTKKIKYLGMMGSDQKVASIYADLKQKGIAEIDLKKVDAPIGLPINSQTPGEIAVSIAAKIIRIKNEVK